jgi:hypothetical protein
MIIARWADQYGAAHISVVARMQPGKMLLPVPHHFGAELDALAD